MKIGLEYEGVICSTVTGQLMRWTEMGPNRLAIREWLGLKPWDPDPVDHYDCLAEVRTEPLTDPSADDLSTLLCDKVQRMNKAFKAAGFDILWREMPIPGCTHYSILAALSNKLKEKITYTINGQGSYGVQRYSSEGNFWRGGGVHINVSDVPYLDAPLFAFAMHFALAKFRSVEWKSNYRKNILYRWREERNSLIAEYMSFGLDYNMMDKRSFLFDVVEVARRFSTSPAPATADVTDDGTTAGAIAAMSKILDSMPNQDAP